MAVTGEPPLEINLRFTSDNGEDDTQAIQSLGFSSEAELDRAVNEALTTWIPRAMFVLVPFFAWLVSLVRRRAGRRYPHHVIFACHVFAVLFGVQAIAVALGYLSGTAVTGPLAVASLLFALISMILAMRAVYGGTIGRAFAHMLVVLAFYWLAAIVVAAAIIVPVLFAR